MTINLLYRGESKYYDSGIIASAYREINNFNNKKILLDYEKIRNEYYREIGSELTATEKKISLVIVSITVYLLNLLMLQKILWYHFTFLV